MTRRRPTPHRERLDLEPTALARHIDHLTKHDLERHARALLAGLALTAEAPGMRIAQDTLAHAKPDGSAPRSVPLCECGCPSQQDHWRDRFNQAVQRDAQEAIDRNLPAITFTRFRAAILRASVDYERTRKAPSTPAHAAERELTHEREQWIIDAYEDMSPESAAVLESARGHGVCSPAAIRLCRRRNDRHPESGALAGVRSQPVLHQAARTLRAAGRSQTQIAAEIGVAQSTISRWQAKDDQQEAA